VTLRLGRYETLRAIASGGMATVYLGRAVGAGGFERLVALKMMHPHIAAEPEFVAMFLDEARLAARVRHPNVVATIDLVEDPLFLVMEYIEGPSLHLLLRVCAKSKRPFSVGIALRIFLDVLAGLHAAHELNDASGEPLNLVHRDVSPQNVLVGVDGVSRITDFGVARAESRLTSTRGSTLKGKLGYMAPEQIRAEQVDRRSDLYAAGVVLWEMLTEQRLFKAENEGALISQILAGPPRGPRSVAPGVPLAVDKVCLRALRPRPDERYPTAAAFADALEQAVAQSPGVALASSRAVAALIKELGLQAQPEHLTGPAMPPPSGPSSGSWPRSLPSPHSYPTPTSQQLPKSQPLPYSHPTPISQSTQLSQVQSVGLPSPPSEPASATGIGAVVSEPALQRPSVRRGVVVGVALATLSLAAGGLVAVGKYELSQNETKAAASASSAAASGGRATTSPAAPDLLEATAAPAAPDPLEATTAHDNEAEGSDPSIPDPGASARAASSKRLGDPSGRTSRPPLRTTNRSFQPKTSGSSRDSTPSPRVTPPPPFRPTEL
jgi:eukaryotic-like serine/threonine-protein kinase